MRTSQRIFDHISKHGPTDRKRLERALGSCEPAVSWILTKMVKTGILERDGYVYSLGSGTLFRTCPKCSKVKEAWCFKDSGICSTCSLGSFYATRAQPGEKKAEKLYPEWKPAVALNRIINMRKFSARKLKGLLRELRACH